MEIENGFELLLPLVELPLVELPLALASGQMGYSKIWALAQYSQELDRAWAKAHHICLLLIPLAKASGNSTSGNSTSGEP